MSAVAKKAGENITAGPAIETAAAQVAQPRMERRSVVVRPPSESPTAPMWPRSISRERTLAGLPREHAVDRNGGRRAG
jgi:hypothetical protein